MHSTQCYALTSTKVFVFILILFDRACLSAVAVAAAAVVANVRAVRV